MSKETCRESLETAAEHLSEAIELLDGEEGLDAFIELYEDLFQQLMRALAIAVRAAAQGLQEGKIISAYAKRKFYVYKDGRHFANEDGQWLGGDNTGWVHSFSGRLWFADKGATTDQASAKAFTLEELKDIVVLDGWTLELKQEG